MSKTKIVELEDLVEIVQEAKSAGEKVVHCHGVFDLLHIGHIRHFLNARKLGDILIITVTPDKYVNKGPGRPAFAEDLRMETLASLDMVDYVAKNRWPMAVETIKLIKPDYYVKGVEYKDAGKDITGGIKLEEEAIESVGGKLTFTDDIVFSSSSLINKHALVFPREVSDYLSGLSARHQAGEILEYLRNAQSLKVLVVGEAIVDEYQYCTAIGKSSKEPTLAVKELYTEKFAGGILAIANHVAGFCDHVGLLTFLGETNTQEEFITKKLNPKIESMFLYRKDSPTIVKKRLIEHYFFTKMLEVYSINDSELDEADNKVLCSKLEEILSRYDLVIVADFGHGMMSPEAVEIVASKAQFLAVNAQANAGNMGFNVISKYPRADYIAMADKELRLESRTHHGDFREMIKDVSEKLSCDRVVVTRGTNGSLCYSRDEGFFDIPALAHRSVVDRVGAGDAFLSVSSLCAVQKAPMEVIGFVGNVVGAWAVGTICNECPADRTTIFRQIETLLK